MVQLPGLSEMTKPSGCWVGPQVGRHSGEALTLTGPAIGPNGNVGQRDVSREPMSIILNLGFSPSWTWIDWENLQYAFLRAHPSSNWTRG